MTETQNTSPELINFVLTDKSTNGIYTANVNIAPIPEDALADYMEEITRAAFRAINEALKADPTSAGHILDPIVQRGTYTSEGLVSSVTFSEYREDN